jgi:hypothetical protein
VQVTVSSDNSGSVMFDVLNELMEDVQGASITFQHQKLYELTYRTTTASDGTVMVADIPEGRYTYNVSATGHLPASGVFTVEPGIVTAAPVAMQVDLVNIEWSVTPVVIEDRYEITITQTFETNVPAPVLIVEPPKVDLPEMAPGEVFQGEFKVTNYGLVGVYDVALEFPGSFGEYDVEVLAGAVPDTIGAMESVTVPYRITRRAQTASVSGAASLYDEVSGYGGVACHGSANITMNAKYTACPNSAQETIMNKSVWHHITFVDYGTDCGSSVIIPDSGGGTYTGPGLWQYQSGGGLEGGNYISELLGLGNPCCGKNACAPCDSDGDGTDDGVCVGNMCTALEAFQECRDGAIVDKTDDPASMDVELVGEPEKDPNFVSWGTMEVKYKVTPESVKATDYKVEVATGTPTRDGHNGLGKSAPKIVSHDATNKSVKFSVGVTGGNTNGSKAKAKPLAVELKFLTTGGELIKKFLLEQDERNVIREEYRAFGVSESKIPSESDFNEQLNEEYGVSLTYDRNNVPRGEIINSILDVVSGVSGYSKSLLTSTYRTPYRNMSIAGGYSNNDLYAKAMSRHVWSSAADVDSPDDYRILTKGIWKKANSSDVIGQINVESKDSLLKDLLETIIESTTGREIYDEDNQIHILEVRFNNDIRSHSENYTVVYMKEYKGNKNVWAKIKYGWYFCDEQQTHCELPYNTEEYQLSADNWEHIGNVIHLQKEVGSDYWGFTK